MPRVFNSSRARGCMQKLAEHVLRHGAPIGGRRANVVDGADVVRHGADGTRSIVASECRFRPRSGTSATDPIATRAGERLTAMTTFEIACAARVPTLRNAT